MKRLLTIFMLLCGLHVSAQTHSGNTIEDIDFISRSIKFYEDNKLYNKGYADALIEMANWVQLYKQDYISALDWHKKHVEVVAAICNMNKEDAELRTAIEEMFACYGASSAKMEFENDYNALMPLISKWEDLLVDIYAQLGEEYIDNVFIETIKKIYQKYQPELSYNFWQSETLTATKLRKLKLYIRQHNIQQADNAFNEFVGLLIDTNRYDLLIDAGVDLVDTYMTEAYYIRAKDLCLYILHNIYSKDGPQINEALVESYQTRLANVAGVYLMDTELAYKILTPCMVIYGPNENEIKNSYHDIGNYILDQRTLCALYQQVYDFDKAFYHIKCAYDTFLEKDSSLNSSIEEMYILSTLGDVCRSLKRYDEAENYLKKAIDIYESKYKDNNTMWPMRIYMYLGNLYYDKQDFTSAKEILNKVYDYCKKNEPNSLNAPASYLAEIYRQEDNYIEAKKYLTISWESFMESVQEQLKTMTPDERSLFWGQYWGFMELYGGQAISAMPHYNDIYYNILLHWKSLLLRTDVDIDRFVRNSDNDDLKELYLMLRRETDLQRKSEYEKEVAYLIASVYPDNSNIIEWQDIQKALKKKDVAIEFAKCWQKDSKQYVTLILRKGWDAPKMVVLCDEQELEQIYKQQYRAYSEVWSKKLYSMIWAKLEPYINEGDDVFFSPAGLLHQMNIEVTKDENGQLANEKYNLHRVSSTRELCIVRPEIGHTSAVLYGGLEYDMDSETMLTQSRAYSRTEDYLATRGFDTDSLSRGNWGKLPNSETEIAAIGEYLRQHGIGYTSYTAQAGTEESFKALSGRRTPIIHLATHGFFFTNEQAKMRSFFDMLDMDNAAARPDNSLKRSGLIMAGAQRAWNGEPIPDSVEDGILLAEEIAAMDLSGTDLVVLSACQTGLGEITSEGVFGLQRAFKKAGVQTLIMSLWSVQDKVAPLMMQTFYREWLSGKSKHEAFAIAQQTVRAKHPDPYYWASFIMLD